MNILNRLDAIERRLDMIESNDASFKYSRGKTNTISVDSELKQLRAIVGLDELNEIEDEQDTLFGI